MREPSVVIERVYCKDKWHSPFLEPKRNGFFVRARRVIDRRSPDRAYRSDADYDYCLGWISWDSPGNGPERRQAAQNFLDLCRTIFDIEY